jgi:hypothetical protein
MDHTLTIRMQKTTLRKEEIQEEYWKAKKYILANSTRRNEQQYTIRLHSNPRPEKNEFKASDEVHKPNKAREVKAKKKWRCFNPSREM